MTFLPQNDDKNILDEPGLKKTLKKNAKKLLERGMKNEQFSEQDQKSFDLVLSRAQKGEFGWYLKIYASLVVKVRS